VKYQDLFADTYTGI